MPAPICPAPMTPTRSIDTTLLLGSFQRPHSNRPRPTWLGKACAVNLYSVFRACSHREKTANHSRQLHTLGAHPQWNWPSSVEPARAVVDDVGSTVVAMRSK